MKFTSEQLLRIMPHCPKDKADEYASVLGVQLQEAEINTCLRVASFLGQIAWETGHLRWWEELADGSAYEGRKDLGNTEPGDGERFKGRGLIHLTGRYNYEAFEKATGLPVTANPELLLQPREGAIAGMWFWTTRKLNERADQFDIMGITKVINGGLNGYEQRRQLSRTALAELQRTASLL